MPNNPHEPYFQAINIKKSWWQDGRETFSLSFSLSCGKGSMTAVLGPSGSGKSSMLRLIAGLEAPDRPSSGDAEPLVLLGGKDITHLPPGKRGIGMVFQSHALFPHMRVDDNIAYGLRARGMSKAEGRRRATAFLERMGLKGFEARMPASLSGGEAQRVSLARALILEPDLVLFDEPLSALDTPLRRRLASDIARMQLATGFTGIFVTHDVEEARQIASIIVEIKEGKIASTCPAGEYRSSAEN